LVVRAVLLDRDGIINDLVYYPEHGIVDSPFVPEQFRLMAGVGPALRRFKELDYLLIVVSNQPGIAKGHFDAKTFEEIRLTMQKNLRNFGVELDGEYYCLHHPFAKRPEYGLDCECRKPKPGLLIQAARDHKISLEDSFMIGDGLVDVQAGKAAGCTTILVASMNSLLSRLMIEQKAEPDFVARTLPEAVTILETRSQSTAGQCDTDGVINEVDHFPGVGVARPLTWRNCFMV